jgi:hypothetical protein
VFDLEVEWEVWDVWDVQDGSRTNRFAANAAPWSHWTTSNAWEDPGKEDAFTYVKQHRDTGSECSLLRRN